MAIYCRKEIYSEGKLVQTTWINEDGSEMPQGFEPEEGDRISPNPPPFLPDCGNYTLAMYQNPGYLRISQSAFTRASLEVTRLESFVQAKNENWAIFKILWDAVVAIASPTSEEINDFIAIAEANNMPFTYSSSGQVIIL
jgi:hypothetical protein